MKINTSPITRDKTIQIAQAKARTINRRQLNLIFSSLKSQMAIKGKHLKETFERDMILNGWKRHPRKHDSLIIKGQEDIRTEIGVRKRLVMSMGWNEQDRRRQGCDKCG